MIKEGLENRYKYVGYLPKAGGEADTEPTQCHCTSCSGDVSEVLISVKKFPKRVS